MNDTCERVDAAVSEWERGLASDAQSLFFIINHARGCARCGRNYSALVPFLRRDAGESSGVTGVDEAPSTGFTDAVMRRATRTRVWHVSGSTMRAVRWALPLAGGVALLIGVGAFVLRGLPSAATEVMVHFSLEAPAASQVSLVGDFNGWRPGQLALKNIGQKGTWEITVPLRKGAVYTYDFLIDGQRWVPDPRSETQVDDDFGGLSSVLRL